MSGRYWERYRRESEQSTQKKKSNNYKRRQRKKMLGREQPPPPTPPPAAAAAPSHPRAPPVPQGAIPVRGRCGTRDKADLDYGTVVGGLLQYSKHDAAIHDEFRRQLAQLVQSGNVRWHAALVSLLVYVMDVFEGREVHDVQPDAAEGPDGQLPPPPLFDRTFILHLLTYDGRLHPRGSQWHACVLALFRKYGHMLFHGGWAAAHDAANATYYCPRFSEDHNMYDDIATTWITCLKNHLVMTTPNLLRRLVNSKGRQWGGLTKAQRRWVLARIVGDKPPQMRRGHRARLGLEDVTSFIHYVRTTILGLAVAPAGAAADDGARVDEDWLEASLGQAGTGRLWRLLQLFVFSARVLGADNDARQFHVLPIGGLGQTRHIQVDTRTLWGVLRAAQVCDLWCQQ